jgi:hypothetical protein
MAHIKVIEAVVSLAPREDAPKGDFKELMDETEDAAMGWEVVDPNEPDDLDEDDEDEVDPDAPSEPAPAAASPFASPHPFGGSAPLPSVPPNGQTAG